MLALVVVLACSSSSTNPTESTGGTGGTSSSDGCTQACTTCPGDPCADCASALQRFRPEFSHDLFACVVAADACSTTVWSDCATAAALNLSTRQADTDYRGACLQKQAACGADGGTSYPDDFCLNSIILSLGQVAAAGSCLQKPCDQIAACLAPIFS